MNRMMRRTNFSFIFLSIMFIASSYVSIAHAGPPWDQIHKMHADDGAAGDGFGVSMAISGNVAVIGAPRDDDHGTDSGSAYLLDVTTGQQIFKLLPIDGAASDQFGSSVAIDGNLAVVGAWSNNDNGSDSGSVYVFDVNTGKQLLKILPSDGAAFDNFGHAVAISGNTVVIGALFDNDKGDRSG